MSSEDSDTVVLDHVPQDQDQEQTATADANPKPTTEPTTRPPPLSRTSTFGRKCWICMSEASEDDPNNPPTWRSPCKCSLTAHEDCLLDWVTNLEDPKTIKRKGQPKILCPQCKSEIKIARPTSYVVNAYRVVDRTVARMVLPAVGTSITGTFLTGLWVYGFVSVFWVFGEQDARRIAITASKHKSWYAAYCLIPINLIFARTGYADFVLPSGTLFLLSTQMTDGFVLDTTVWPPLPSTVFACLPAVRTMYNWCYYAAFCNLNQRWLSEVQPRREDTPEGQEQNIADLANAHAAEEDGVVLELEVNLGVGGGHNEDEDAAEQGDGGEDVPVNGDAQAGEQNGHVHRLLGDRGDIIVDGTSSAGQTIMGALAFPAVAAGMGKLLSFALPASWLGPANTFRGRPGLLRTQWGRSVVGGALFIVLKDAITLYYRWRLAQSHRHRRIVDYDKKTKTYLI